MWRLKDEVLRAGVFQLQRIQITLAGTMQPFGRNVLLPLGKVETNQNVSALQIGHRKPRQREGEFVLYLK